MGAALLAFITAIALAGIAGWFSITGLMAIFAALPIPIAIMAAVLEVGKLVTASVLYRNWKTLPGLIKTYLATAVVILMFITSLGIFGYLSKAHIEQGAPVGDNFAKIERLDQRIAREQRSINDAETVIKELDGVIATLIEYDKISGPDGARAVREKQAEDRAGLKEIIDSSQDNIDEFLDMKAEYAGEIRAFETEIGPIKYIAAMAYDNPEDHYEEAVRYIILLLIFVFDPLAVLLLIAANHIQMQNRPQPTPPSPEPEPNPEPADDEFWETDLEDLSTEVDEETYTTLSEVLDAELGNDVNPRLRELLNTPTAWEEESELGPVKINEEADKVDETSIQELLDQQSNLSQTDAENELMDVDTELKSRGYTTFAQLSIEPDEVLKDVVATLNTKERTRTLTPTENKWRNSCLNILDRRRNNNPLYDVKNISID